MIVWYAIPTANPERASRCLAVWRERGYRTAVLVDGDTDTPAGVDAVLRKQAWRGYFAASNDLARQAVEAWGADIVVCGGDDIYPDPHRTADEIGEEFIGAFPDMCGVMQPTGDDLPGTDRICGSPWLGREWVRRANCGTGPFWGGYHQFYGDEELRVVATRADRLIDVPALVQRHEHWLRPGAEPQTDYQRRNDQHWDHDSALFLDRVRARFPGSELA